MTSTNLPPHTRPAGKKGSLGRLAKLGSAAVLIRFLSAALGYALLVVLARWMDTEAFGHFGFAFSLALTLAIVLDLGQRRLVLRFFAAYRGRGRSDLARALLRFSLRLSLGAALLGAGGLALATYLLDAHPSLYAAAALTAAMIVSDYQSHALRGLGPLIPALMPREVVWRPLTVGLMALAGGSVAIMVSATTALWALAGVLLAVSLVQFLAFSRPTWRRVLAHTESDATDPNPAETKLDAQADWRGTSLRLWAISALNQGLTPLTVVIVGLFVPPAETGAFFAAMRTATIIAFPLQALNLMAAPMLAKAYAAENRPRLQQVAGFTAGAAGLAALLGAGVLIVFGPTLLALMNPDFVAAQNIQLVIMSGYVVAALCGSTGQLLTMTGHETVFLWILGICNGAGLLVIVALAALFGPIGAAWGYVVMKAGWNVSVAVWSRRNLALDPSVVGLVLPPKGQPT